jgi:hypothetical protein
VVLTALVLLRQPDSRSWDTVWAEDGVVFAHDAIEGPALLTLFKGYAGYANLAPRLLALPVALLPVSQLARALAGASAAFDVLLALFVFRMTAGIIRSVWLRSLLTAMTALAPVFYIEANASIANVNWTLLFAAFWAIVAVADRRSDVVLRAAVLFVAIASTPLIVLYAPLAVVTYVARRSRTQLVVLLALAAGGVVQLLAALATADTTPAGSTAVSDLGPILGARVAGSMLVGERPLPDLWIDHGIAFALMAGTVLGLVLAVLAWRAERDAKVFAAICAVQALVVFAVPIALRGSKAMQLADGAYNLNGSRYLVAPILVLLSGMLVLADRQRPATRDASQWVRGVLVAHGVVLIATSYSLNGARAEGPSWEGKLLVAEDTCRAGGQESVLVPITPRGGLVLELDCDRVTS